MSKLQELRKSMRMTQPDLHKLSGIALRSIKDYEQGCRDINKASVSTLYRLSLVLGCEIKELIESIEEIEDDIDDRIVKQAVETEMDKSCHADYVEEYNTPLEFYLSNAEEDSYIGYLQDRFGISEEKAIKLQRWIIKEIEDGVK
ncbi:helix-turn-helix domain-containing protein [Lachnoclostridium sp.]|uniref:helix-turn-helix domain-containing protein n=1 Tax=Lachnoclostridium sp. TaxID=2028282 RepID=UPI00289EDCDA|nr:helix-turn-helix transcriptional regulator [Lachnoclostridium sp.]